VRRWQDINNERLARSRTSAKRLASWLADVLIAALLAH
jgi:hypothetical protein